LNQSLLSVFGCLSNICCVCVFTDEMASYVRDLIDLIEQTFTKNNNTPVVLLGHSMGNLYILYTLNQMPQAWKDKYIRSFISLSGPWGGSVKTLRLMASGDWFYILVVCFDCYQQIVIDNYCCEPVDLSFGFMRMSQQTKAGETATKLCNIQFLLSRK
jgi:pimeloyl-ACP methyl ester carboxylesterase